MRRLHVGVLRGGPSSEHEVSHRSGQTVLENLPEHYVGWDIYIDKEGQWHINGTPLSLYAIFQRVDVVYNALHGAYGEDGFVQRVLDTHHVPYTGSRVIAAALSMNKRMTKRYVELDGVLLPDDVMLEKDGSDHIARVEAAPGFPCVVKPVVAGSSVGVSVVNDKESLRDALDEAFTHSSSVLVEEYIEGREATCGVVERYSGQSLYSLPPVEIIPSGDHLFFDYTAKYGGGTEEICPGNFTEEQERAMRHSATLAHKSLGLSHYSRSDFIVTRKGVYFLETNSLPGLTAGSLLPVSLKADGISLSEFFDHVIMLAHQGR